MLVMNEAIRTEWAEALRSGLYSQGKSALRSSEDKFCCLGVLCEIAVEYGVIAPPIRSNNSFDYSYAEGYQSWLPPEVTKWAGLESDEGAFGRDILVKVDDRSYPSLAQANDYGVTFDKIADIIEGVDDGSSVR